MNLLLVDDDPEIQFLAKFVLEQSGTFDVTGVETGADAKTMLQEMVFDALLLDVMLPDTNGLDFYEEMKKNLEGKTPPVIFLTAKEEEQVFRRMQQLGAVGFIQKPFNPSRLAEQVKSMLSVDG